MFIVDTQGVPSVAEIVELAAADYGDAPEAPYATTRSNSGPRHVITPTLHLGEAVEEDDDGQQHPAAASDEADDGVANPRDLEGTEGAPATVTLLATNNSGTDAILSGWIDYDRDGTFSNATERAQITVPNGTADSRFTLTFPTIPIGSHGTTFVRFRFSTDLAAANPIGAAVDGEVEDDIFTITAKGVGIADSAIEIAHETTGGPTLNGSDFFGLSVASIADLNGDGRTDLAVGAPGDDTGGPRGSIYLLPLFAPPSPNVSRRV